jgi:hypothetical protein
MSVAEKAGCEQSISQGAESKFCTRESTGPQKTNKPVMMVPQALRQFRNWRVRKRVSRAMLTSDSHPAREVRVLRRHRAGEWEGELGADFTSFFWPGQDFQPQESGIRINRRER